MQQAYWCLKAEFDKLAQSASGSTKPQQSSKRMHSPNKAETPSIVYIVNDLQQKLKVKEAELTGMRQSMDRAQRDNEAMRAELETVKAELEKVKEKNVKISKLTISATQKRRIKKNTMSELYLNSNRIKEYLDSIEKYGKLYQGLKTRQKNLIECVGNEDSDILRIRMQDLYKDISSAGDGFENIRESLDNLKIESQGKEFDLMTRDKERILLLKKENCLQAAHLDEYVKKNQALQKKMVDREMKLRQALNQLNYVQRRGPGGNSNHNHVTTR